MSTWMYLQCEDHDPPMRADDESGQHWYDVPQIIADVKDRDYMARLHADTYGEGLAYFRKHTARFLAAHPKCRVTLWTQYDEEVDLTTGEKKEPTDG